MKRILAVFGVPVLAGCLTTNPPEVSFWPLEYKGTANVSADARFGVARVSQVLVRAPYNSAEITVLRADGSLAFDAYNEYAAVPSSLLKGVLVQALQASGRFKAVVNASSSVRSAVSVEMFVGRMALDCRTTGERHAVVELLVRIIGEGDEIWIVKGEGRESAADGNYGVAFSKAVTAALESALGGLR